MNPQTLSGRKLDEAIAVKLLGWKRTPELIGWWNGVDYVASVPPYSKSSYRCEQVLDWLHKHEVFRIGNTSRGRKSFWAITQRNHIFIARGRTLPIAVCRLALWCKENP